MYLTGKNNPPSGVTDSTALAGQRDIQDGE